MSQGSYDLSDFANNNLCSSKYTTKTGGVYNIIRYDKSVLSDNHPLGVFRSVIMDENDKTVCFAPPKSFTYDSFVEAHPLKTESIIAEEFVEGTMVNVFWDALIGDWNIATRSTVGGEVSFYKKSPHQTFHSMFYDAVQHCNLNLLDLNNEYCYSFVLQHPSNRIVVPIVTPALYLVEVYHIQHPFVSVVPRESINLSSTGVCFPKVYEWYSYQDLIDTFATQNTPYSTLGVVIKNTETQQRTKIRNPVYEQVRRLRGNQPKLQYQYLSLRKTGKVGEFLKFYPEHKKDFSQFRDELHVFTVALYVNYVECYIKKSKPLGEFPGQFKTHMFHIHKLYIDELKEKKMHITNRTVIEYVNNLHESQQLNALHYNIKKQFADFQALDKVA